MNINLRPSTPDDVEFALKLYYKGLRPQLMKGFGKIPPEMETDFLSILRKSICQGKLQIIEQGKKPAGHIKTIEYANGIDITDFIVHPEHRGKGIASQTLIECQKLSRKLDKPLTLDVLEGNTAIELYKKMGFVVDTAPLNQMDGQIYMRWESGEN